jgi:hypothetical protein
MKPLQVVLPGAAAALSVLLAIQPAARAADWTAGMKQGKAELKSMGPIAFGPEGILFIADTKAASVVAVATGETKAAPAASFKVEGLNRLIAGVLGTTADQILIADLAVHPVTHQPYLAVSRGRGPDAVPALIRMKADGQPELVSLD